MRKQNKIGNVGRGSIWKGRECQAEFRFCSEGEGQLDQSCGSANYSDGGREAGRVQGGNQGGRP